MPLKLKLRNGVWQAVGTIVCKDGRKVFVRKSTGHTFHEKSWATKKLSDILLETMQSEPKREDTVNHGLESGLCKYMGQFERQK